MRKYIIATAEGHHPTEPATENKIKHFIQTSETVFSGKNLKFRAFPVDVTGRSGKWSFPEISFNSIKPKSLRTTLIENFVHRYKDKYTIVPQPDQEPEEFDFFIDDTRRSED